jgi:hypothetical protein
MWTVAALGAALGGVAYRCQDFGRYGFWNDEAWVALGTRVEGWAQWWLALSVTPIGWAGLLRALGAAPGPPEFVLRLLPLVASVATLAVVYRLGTRVAGHLAGGVAAVALVAFDATAVEYAKVLKQYSAEALLAALAVDAALRVKPDGAGVGWLGLLLVGGALFSNAQLLIALPLLAALCLQAWRCRAPALARTTLGCALVVVPWLVAVWAVCLRSHQTPGLAAYFMTGFLPLGSVGEAVAAAASWMRALALAALGPIAAPIVAGALVVQGLRRDTAPAAWVLGLLLVELLALSALRILPLTALRLFLFAITLLQTIGAAALVGVAVAAPAGPGRALAVALVLLALGDVMVRRDWTRLGRATQVEDLGPLVRELSRQRTPADRVAVYPASAYVVASYLDEPPVLEPAPMTTVGYTPRLPAGIQVVPAAELERWVADAVAAHARVWFVGSRIKAEDAAPISRVLERERVLLHQQRQNAALVLVAGGGGP